MHNSYSLPGFLGFVPRAHHVLWFCTVQFLVIKCGDSKPLSTHLLRLTRHNYNMVTRRVNGTSEGSQHVVIHTCEGYQYPAVYRITLHYLVFRRGGSLHDSSGKNLTHIRQVAIDKFTKL